MKPSRERLKQYAFAMRSRTRVRLEGLALHLEKSKASMLVEYIDQLWSSLPQARRRELAKWGAQAVRANARGRS